MDAKKKVEHTVILTIDAVTHRAFFFRDRYKVPKIEDGNDFFEFVQKMQKLRVRCQGRECSEHTSLDT